MRRTGAPIICSAVRRSRQLGVVCACQQRHMLAHADPGVFLVQLLAKRSPVDEWQPRFVPDNVTGGSIQPALLRAAQLAVNEGGSVMLTVRRSVGCGAS